MIIDAHSHIEPLQEFQGSPHTQTGWTVPDLKNYLSNYSSNGVDACFVFMSKGLRLESLLRESNDGLARLRDQAPGRLYPWATVHPAWPEKQLRAEIRRAVKSLGLYGIKLVPIVQGYPISAPGMDIIAEEAIGLGAPVTIHDGSPEYCSPVQVVYYARKYPGLKVLSAHSGLRELWPEFINPMKELDNLWLCLSGPVQLGIQTLYDELGPERLLFGSDGGIGHPAVITAYLRRINSMDAPSEHKKMILGGNAARFLSV